jgi:hypothetical protein
MIRWFPVNKNILDCSFRDHKNDCTPQDETNSISSLIPQDHAVDTGNNILPQEDKLITCCLPRPLFLFFWHVVINYMDGPEQFYLRRYNAVYPLESQPTFLRNMSPEDGGGMYLRNVG